VNSLTICSIKDCKELHYARGYCHKHYMGKRRRGELETVGNSKKPLIDRIKHKCAPVNENGCVLWTGNRNRGGLAIIKVEGRGKLVAEALWEINKGEIPENMTVRHICDRGHEGCVSPHHLYLGHKKQKKIKEPSDGNKKLTEDQVLEIRERREDFETREKLAEEFDVDVSTITDITKRRTWRHI